jgi:hypothetical protein
MRFGKQILGAAGRIPGNKYARRAGNYGARVGKNARFKYGQSITQGKYASRALAMNPELRKKIWGKPFTKTSTKNRQVAMAASDNWSKGRVKPDFFPRISAMSHGSKRVIGTGALLGVSAAGFSSGFNSQNQVSNSMYNLAFGNPDYDKYVMGRKMGVRSLIAPLPGETRMMAYTPRAYSDAWRASRKQQPKVDGSIAFGMYNSRLG